MWTEFCSKIAYCTELQLSLLLVEDVTTAPLSSRVEYQMVKMHSQAADSASMYLASRLWPLFLFGPQKALGAGGDRTGPQQES